MNSGQTDSKAGGQGSEARAITTADEDKVRAALPASSGFGWYADGKLRAIDGCVHNSPEWHPRVAEAAARAGIVPGPAGWCWAAAPAARADECIGCSHSLGSHDRSDGSCIYCNCPAFVAATPVAVEEPDAAQPPAWLTAAVLAELPPDGQALAFGPLMRAVLDHPACKGRFRMGDEIAGQVRAAVDAAVASGEIEAGEQPGTWRRPLPKPAPSPSPQPEGRPARLRAALLAVLQSGPVHTTADLLPALDAAMGERAGVAVATGAEAMRAAREIGARVDGVEWSLPAVPDGWGWRGSESSADLLRSSGTYGEQIATAYRDGSWTVFMGEDNYQVREGGTADPPTFDGARDAALTAARLAGLFAAPRASADDAAPKGPPVVFTAQNGEGVEPCRHVPTCNLARSILIDRDTSRIEAALAAFRADVVAEALARTIDHAAATRGDSEAADPLRRVALAVSAARQRLAAADPGTDEWSAADIEVARTTGALLDAVGVDVEEVAGDARHAQRIAENERDEARSELAAMEQRADEQRQRAKQAERVLAEARFDLITAQEAVAREVEAIKRAEEERDAALAAAEGERQRVQGIIARAERVEGERDAALHNYSRECALSESLRSQLEAAEDERDEALAERTTAVEARMRAEIEEEKAARERDAALATIAKIGAMLDPVLAAIAGGREAGK